MEDASGGFMTNWRGRSRGCGVQSMKQSTIATSYMKLPSVEQIVYITFGYWLILILGLG